MLRTANAPDVIDVKALLRTHSKLDLDHERRLWALYEGGKTLNPKEFLPQAFSEPSDLYRERVGRSFYLNYLGQIVDSFTSNLFLEEPRVSVAGTDVMPDFYEGFLEACDEQRREPIHEFMAGVFTRTLVHRRAWVWADMPMAPTGDVVPNRAQQEARGDLDVYLMQVTAQDMLDWKCLSDGTLEWCVLYFTEEGRDAPWTKDPIRTHRWYVLTVDGTLLYEAEQVLKDGSDDFKSWKETAKARLADGYPVEHDLGRVPMVPITVPPALDVGDKLFTPAIKVFQLDNEVAWREHRNLLSMPVIQTKREFKQIIGTGHWLHLQPGDSYGFLESDGVAIEKAMESVDRIRTEMFRVVHQMAQALKAEAATAGRSGESKRRDSSPTVVVLDAMGKRMRADYAEVLQLVAQMRGEEDRYDWQVNGFDEFDVDAFADWLREQTASDALHIPSEGFKKSQAKKRMRRMDRDLTETELEQFDKEIDAHDYAAEAEAAMAPRGPAGNTGPRAAGFKAKAGAPGKKPGKAGKAAA